jgi:hypothetical protein
MGGSGTIPAHTPVMRGPPTNRGRKRPPEPLTPVEVEQPLAGTGSLLDDPGRVPLRAQVRLSRTANSAERVPRVRGLSCCFA